MSWRMLSTLFFCCLVSSTIGSGLAPLLPVYATDLGASPSQIGAYLSLSCLSIALGFVFGGWMADRFQRRKTLFICAGMVTMPLTYLMGSMSNIWQLAAVTILAWFNLSVGVIQVWNLAGIFADPSGRGRIFGLLSSTAPMGALLGGLSFGFVADRWGYARLFVLIAGLLAAWTLAGLLLQDRQVDKPPPAQKTTPGAASWLSGPFVLLLLATFLLGVAHVVGMLSRSLSMDRLGLSATAISSTGAVGGLVSLPMPAILGVLSDRLGRTRCLYICYALCSTGLLLLALPNALWVFWVAMSFLFVARSGANGVSSAMITDMVSMDSLGKGFSMGSTAALVGGIVGYPFAGYAIDRLGLETTLVLGATLPALGILLVLPIRHVGRVVRAP